MDSFSFTPPEVSNYHKNDQKRVAKYDLFYKYNLNRAAFFTKNTEEDNV